MMKKSKKICLIAAALLVVTGIIISVVIMTICDWDFSRLSTVEYETNTYEVDEDFKNLSISTSTPDIVFEPSDDEKCRIVCYEQKNLKHSVDVREETLEINETDTRKWYEFIGIGLGNTKITIYLPQAEYDSLLIKENTGDIDIPEDFEFENIDISADTGDVRCGSSVSGAIEIKLSTGNITLKDMTANELELSVSTGKVDLSSITCKADISIGTTTGRASLSDVACKNITSDGSTGDISLKNVISDESITIKRSTGDVEFDSCDAAELSIETSTGDVTGTLLSEKVFITHSSTGSVDVPKTVTGGRCEITTSTGDVMVSIKTI